MPRLLSLSMQYLEPRERGSNKRHTRTRQKSRLNYNSQIPPMEKVQLDDLACDWKQILHEIKFYAIVWGCHQQEPAAYCPSSYSQIRCDHPFVDDKLYWNSSINIAKNETNSVYRSEVILHGIPWKHTTSWMNIWVYAKRARAAKWTTT